MPGLVLETSERPLRKTFALWAVGLSILAGVVAALQAGFGFERFGAIQFATRAVVLRIVRELAPGVAASAAFYALVTWAHGLEEADLRSRRRTVTMRASVMALAALPVVAAIEAAVSAGIFRVVFGVRWSDFGDGAAALIDAMDLVGGLGIFAIHLALLVLVSWLTLPRLSRTRLGLGPKIVAAWLAGVVLQTVGLVVTS